MGNCCRCVCRPNNRGRGCGRGAGGQDEFYGVKEYRQGESPRMIYWRRSARTGTLVSKEMTHIAPPRIIIFVDTFIKDRTLANHAEVERAIAMAASLASRTIDQGLAVGRSEERRVGKECRSRW